MADFLEVCEQKKPGMACCYIWRINNYNRNRKVTGFCLQSPKFYFSDSDSVSFNLRLYPKGDEVKNCKYLSLFVDAVFNPSTLRACTPKNCKFKFSIIDSQNKQRFVKEDPFLDGLKNGSAGYPQYVLKDVLSDAANDLFDLLPEGALTVCCEITNIENVGLHNTPEYSLAADMAMLLESRKYSDVKLIAKKTEFQAHKAILAARSDVFLAMFEHQMSETMYNSVKIEDVDDQVLQEMLRFIYTGNLKLGIDDENLLIASDKYLLYELKKMCEESLCSTMNIKNVLHRLILAERHTSEVLKSHAIDFLNTHPDEVMKTDEWLTVVRQHPRLIAEALSAVSKEKIYVGEPLINASGEKNLKYIYLHTGTSSKGFSETTPRKLSEDVIEIKLPTFRINMPICWSYTWLKDVSRDDASYVWQLCGLKLNTTSIYESWLISESFQSCKNRNIKWHLELHVHKNIMLVRRPRPPPIIDGTSRESYTVTNNLAKAPDKCTIMLVLECSNGEEIDTEFKISMRTTPSSSADSSNVPEPSEFKGKNVFSKVSQSWKSNSFKVPNFSQLMSPDRNRTVIQCTLSSVMTNIINLTLQKKSEDVDTPSVGSLPVNLYRLLESQKLSDVTLVVKEHEIHAHKAILTSRSCVFSDMFEGNFNQNRVEIHDMDDNVFRETLRFIYTGEVSPTFEMEKMSLHLLDAAYKYALDDLKVICENFLFTNLSIENAAHALTIVDRHKIIDMKERTTEYIRCHLEEVLKTEGWERLIQNHPPLLVNIYKSVVKELIPHPY